MDNCGDTIIVTESIVVLSCQSYWNNKGLITVYNIENMEEIGNQTGTNPGDYFGQSLSVMEVYQGTHNVIFSMTNSSSTYNAYYFEVIIDLSSTTSSHFVGELQQI